MKYLSFLFIGCSLLLNCCSINYFQHTYSHIDHSINGTCKNYHKIGEYYSITLRGNLINKKYGIYNIKFKTDSTDTVYINKKDITYYGDKDSSCCKILMTNEILSDSINLLFHFKDDKDIEHTLIFGKKREFDKSRIIMIPTVIIADIVTLPIQIVGGAIVIIVKLISPKSSHQ
jgi:hypothetical protein